ncbi:glycosyltransferase family 2 protein [bacterium]|nr:glycosyltransferase family 2 protein [bacterium]
MPKVSIIMPVYNAQDMLARTLDSLLNQTFDDYEVVCINDGSKDDSLKILEEYSKKSDKIKIIDQPNSGPALARHNGIKQSESKYIMFCDSDDKYEPTMVEEMYKTIEENQVDFAMCIHNIFDLVTKKVYPWENKGYYKTDFGKLEMAPNKVIKTSIYLWNKIIKREILEKNSIEYPTKYEHDDTVFMIRYFSCCKNYFVIDKPLYLYTTNNSNSIMGKFKRRKSGSKLFDYIFSHHYLLEYWENNEFTDEEYKYFFDFLIGGWRSNYNHLPNKAKKQAREYMLESILKYKNLFSKSEILSRLITSQETKDFNKVFSFDNFTFFQRIFSVVNIEMTKYLIIFNIKIKLKRLKYE